MFRKGQIGTFRKAGGVMVREHVEEYLLDECPNWECKLVYPTGGEIAIKGHGRYFTVKDYQK